MRATGAWGEADLEGGVGGAGDGAGEGHEEVGGEVGEGELAEADGG